MVNRIFLINKSQDFVIINTEQDFTIGKFHFNFSDENIF